MDDLQKIDFLQKRVTEHLTDVKRWERKSRKNQKRADELQKEKDQRTNELSKQTSMKQKLETLCRELQKENNKLKVCSVPNDVLWYVYWWLQIGREQRLSRLGEEQSRILGRKVQTASLATTGLSRSKGPPAGANCEYRSRRFVRNTPFWIIFILTTIDLNNASNLWLNNTNWENFISILSCALRS